MQVPGSRDCRAAFVALAAIIIVALWRSRTRRGGAACALLWMIPLLLAGAAGLYFLKRGSADGRMLIWLVSSLSIAERPVAGHGVGSFLKSYSEGQAAFFSRHPDSAFVEVAGAPEYPFNELLGVGVEQGTIGMLFFISIAVLSVGRLLKRRDELAYGWIALLVCSLASYPFALLPFRVLAVLFVARAANLPAGRSTIVICNMLMAVFSQSYFPVLFSHRILPQSSSFYFFFFSIVCLFSIR